jgi:hypothetical protein
MVNSLAEATGGSKNQSSPTLRALIIDRQFTHLIK